MGTSQFTAGGNPAMDLHPIEILLVTSCYRHKDELWPDGPLVLNADFISTNLPSPKAKGISCKFKKYELTRYS